MARRWKVLTVTSVAVFMALLDVTIVNIAFPDIRRSFPHDSLGDLSWILNAYNIVLATALVPAGRIADRLGRRRLFLAGVLVFLAASLACGLAGNVPMLVGARVVQALGAAVLVPTSLSLVLPEFPVTQRATATSLWTATGAIAAAAGPSLGGFLVDWQGWRWVFFVNLLIGLPALIPARRLLAESRDEHATRWPDAVGATLLTAGVAALALGLVKGQDWGWTSAAVLGAFGASGLLLALFAVRTSRHPAPVLEFALFRIRSFSVAVLGSFVFGAGFFALLTCNVLFLTGVWHMSLLTAGAALTPAPIMAALSAPVAGRLADRFGQRAIAVPGTLLFAAGALILVAGTGSGRAYLTEFLPGALVTGTGVGFTLPAFGSAAVAELPPARFATGIGVSACLRQLGAVVGIAALVVVLGPANQVGRVTTFHHAWLFIAGTAALALIAAVALGRVRPRRIPRPGAKLDTAVARQPGHAALLPGPGIEVPPIG